MPKLVTSLVQGQERSLMTLSAELLAAYPSLKSTAVVQAKLAAALDEEERRYVQDPRRLIRNYDAHVQKMLELDAKMARLKKELDRHRHKILEVWAMKGLTEVGGATVVPQTSLLIAHLEALKRLPQSIAETGTSTCPGSRKLPQACKGSRYSIEHSRREYHCQGSASHRITSKEEKRAIGERPVRYQCHHLTSNAHSS